MMDETLPIDTVLQGDSLEVLKTLPDNSVDAVVTDPPYALTSGRLRVGYEHCLRYILLQVMFPDFDYTDTKRLKAFKFAPVSPDALLLHGVDGLGIDARVTMPVGSIDFEDDTVTEHEIDNESKSARTVTKRELSSVGDTESVQLSGDFILQLRGSARLSFCKGACSCYRSLSSSLIAFDVVIPCSSFSDSFLRSNFPGFTGGVTDDIRLCDDSLSSSLTSTSVVTSQRAEMTAMLTLDLRRGTFKLDPTISTGEAHFRLQALPSQFVGTSTRAGSLSSKLQTSSIGEIDSIADRTGAFNLFIHPDIISFFSHYTINKGFMGKEWDNEAIAFSVDLWKEAMRVLRPGGHLLAFGGTRTYHRLVAAIEDAGFEIRDQIAWLYGSGFPKSHNISVAIDKHLKAEREVVGMYDSRSAYDECERTSSGKYDKFITGDKTYGAIPVTAPASSEAQRYSGYGTALKPSMEPICLARKPLSERTIAANVLRWGTGGLNIDATRVSSPDKAKFPSGIVSKSEQVFGNGEGLYNNRPRPEDAHIGKRWPANTVLSHSPACRRIGTKRVRGDGHKAGQIIVKTNPDSYGFTSPHKNERHQDSEGMETVESYDCSDDCPVRALDRQSGIRKSGGGIKSKGGHSIGLLRGEDAYHFKHDGVHCEPSEGTASRYFNIFTPDELDAPFLYVAKASRRERDAGLEHLPTSQGFDKNTSKQIAHVNPDTGETTYSDYIPSARHNTHPTVKPLSLCKFLVRLCCPEGGVVLDPFCGSGSIPMAACLEGMHYIGIEQSEEYCTIARARIAHAQTQTQASLWQAAQEQAQESETESEVA